MTTSADLFTADMNARRVLTRLGERIPAKLFLESVQQRYLVGAHIDGNTVDFVDGSRASRAADGEWRALGMSGWIG